MFYSRGIFAGLLFVGVLHSVVWALNEHVETTYVNVQGPDEIIEGKPQVIIEDKPEIKEEVTYLPDEVKTSESLEQEEQGGKVDGNTRRVKAKHPHEHTDWISEYAWSTIKRERRKAKSKRFIKKRVKQGAKKFARKSKTASPVSRREQAERLVRASYDEALRSVKQSSQESLGIKKPVAALNVLDCGGRVCQFDQKCVTRRSQVDIDRINKRILKHKQDYTKKVAIEVKKHKAALSSRILKDDSGEKFSHACQGGSVAISCPAEYMIHVLRGFYGRTSDAYCNHGRPKTYQCSSPHATGVFAVQCNGKQSCRVNSDSGVFGEPCAGTYKYATVIFKCRLSANIRKHYDSERLHLNLAFQLKIKGLHDASVRQLKFLRNLRAKEMRGSQLCVAKTSEGPRLPVVPEQGIMCGSKRCRINQRCVSIRQSAKTVSNIEAEIKKHEWIYQTKHADLTKQHKVALGKKLRLYLPEQFSHACEHATMTVTCPPNYVIQVIRGFYGRITDAYCNFGKPKTFSCSSDRANRLIRKLCNMKNSCDVKVTYNEFGDPCPDTFKYASIHYRCSLSFSVQEHHATFRRRLIRRFRRQFKELDRWHIQRLKVLNRRMDKATHGKYRCLSKRGLGDQDDRQRQQHGSGRGPRCGQTRCSRRQKCVRTVSKRRLEEIRHKIRAVHREFKKTESFATQQQQADIDSKTLPIYRPEKHDFACEGGSVRISCPDNYGIHVLRGFYGRTSDAVCATGPRKDFKCSSPNADRVVMSRCNDKQACTVESNNEVFGDPCAGTYKYLTVNYRCRLTIHAEKQLETERSRLTNAFIRRISELRHRYSLTIASLKDALHNAGSGKERCVRRERRRPDIGIQCGGKRCKPKEKCVVKKSKKQIRQLNDGIIALTSLFNQKIAAFSQEQLSALRRETPAIYMAEKFDRACEGAALSIQCPKNYVIQVLRGFYGRTSKTFCAHGPRKTNRCSSSTANSRIISACNNKQSCKVKSSSSVFWDPCVGTYKYMTINYKCRLSSTVAKQFQVRREQFNLRYKASENALRIVYNRQLASMLRKLSRAKLGSHCCLPDRQPDKQSRGGGRRNRKSRRSRHR